MLTISSSKWKYERIPTAFNHYIYLGIKHEKRMKESSGMDNECTYLVPLANPTYSRAGVIIKYKK